MTVSVSEVSRGGAHVAADQRAGVLRCLDQQAREQIVHAAQRQIGGSGQCERKAERPSAHRGQVGQVRDQRAAPDVPTTLILEAKVDPFDRRIGRDHHVLARARPQHRRVVSDPDHHRARRRHPPRRQLDPIDQPKLTEIPKPHPSRLARIPHSNRNTGRQEDRNNRKNVESAGDPRPPGAKVAAGVLPYAEDGRSEEVAEIRC